jgi:hypothetical protein
LQHLVFFDAIGVHDEIGSTPGKRALGSTAGRRTSQPLATSSAAMRLARSKMMTVNDNGE